MKKRIAALLLALLMVGSSASMLACDKGEGTETSISETDIAETTAPETQATETAASETEATETAAPETEVTETEAPETEAAETEATETVAPFEAPEGTVNLAAAGTLKTSSENDIAAAFDGTVATGVRLGGAGNAYWMGVELAQPSILALVRLATIDEDGDGKTEAPHATHKAVIEGSNDGEAWEFIMQFGDPYYEFEDYAMEYEAGNNYWTEYAFDGETDEDEDATDPVAYKYYRVWSDDGNDFWGEVEFWGTLVEVAETAAPETAAPETAAPETQAPETAAPETQAPETAAPETQAPETAAPETAAPETQAPETAAPETTAPVTGEYPVKSLKINGADISEYVITINGATSSTVIYAASELQKYIALTTGVTLPISNEAVAAGTKRILIDSTSIVSDDSIYRHYTDADGLVIVGDATRGAMYSVYHFLEQKLTWKFFASDTEVCYGADSIELSNIDYTYEHQYKIRDLYFYDLNNFSEFRVKRYLNGDSGDMTNYGGAVVYTPLGIHNFGSLSQSGNGSDPNPCLNSAMIRKLMLRNIKAYLADHPDTICIQVSQNDTDRRCECEDCKADDEYYGAASGSIVELMNYFAEKLEKDYPNLKIVTFAYRYSIFAPENIVCHPNVVIEFTPIDMCRQHAITYDSCSTDGNEYPDSQYPTFMTDNQVLMQEMEKWSKICSKVYMYDYGLNCRYYWVPFPDINDLYDNYQVFNAMGAWGYINLSNPHKPSAEFGELRAYVTLKLMEDPDMTREEFNTHINEFLAAFYGPGWELIREYYDFIEKLADDHGECFCGFNSPEQMFGDHAFAPYSDQLVEWFDKAEAMASNETELLHVRRLRVSMDYVRIGSIHYTEMNSGDDARVQAMIAEVENFYNEVFELGVEWISDAGQVPTVTDFTINPREWGTIAPHTQIYNETLAK